MKPLAVVLSLTYLRFRGGMRLKKFGDQLEMVLRTIAGAVRVGVGLRQAFVIVIEELPNPAKKEFRRVVGRTNIGIPLVDALDETAKTIPGNEMKMFIEGRARAATDRRRSRVGARRCSP